MTTPTRFTLTESSDSLWRVTFNNPPLNVIDSVMISELDALFSRIESSDTVAVVVFDSADPDFFLAHIDIVEIANDDTEAKTVGTPPRLPHPWLTSLARLNTLPAVTISSIRGRARGAGSEFVIATDLRFASREKATWPVRDWSRRDTPVVDLRQDCLHWSGGDARSRSSSVAAISMETSPNDMATSTSRHCGPMLNSQDRWTHSGPPYVGQ
jgi:hypothetical protein